MKKLVETAITQGGRAATAAMRNAETSQKMSKAALQQRQKLLQNAAPKEEKAPAANPFAIGLSKTQSRKMSMGPAMAQQAETSLRPGTRPYSKYVFHKAITEPGPDGKPQGVQWSQGHAAGGVKDAKTGGPKDLVEHFHSWRQGGKTLPGSTFHRDASERIPADAPYPKGISGFRQPGSHYDEVADLRKEKRDPDTVVIFEGDENFEAMKDFIANRHPEYYQVTDSAKLAHDAINCVTETRDMLVHELETREIFTGLAEELETTVNGDTSVAELAEILERFEGRDGVSVYRKGRDY